MLDVDLYDLVAQGRGNLIKISPEALNEFEEIWLASFRIGFSPPKSFEPILRRKLKRVMGLPVSLSDVLDSEKKQAHCVVSPPFLFFLRKDEGEGYVVVRVIEVPKSFPSRRMRVGNQLDLSRVTLSDHAVSRFCERYKLMKGEEVKNSREVMLAYLSSSQEEGAISTPGKVLEQPARHFAFKGMCFVVAEKEGRYLVTTVK